MTKLLRIFGDLLPTDVWVTTRDRISQDGTFDGLGGTIYHYDGVAWTLADSVTGYLASIWGSAADNIWAAGSVEPEAPSPLQIFRFDGISWGLQQVLGTSTSGAKLWGNSSDDVWAFLMGSAAEDRLLVSRNQGGAWSVLSEIGGPVQQPDFTFVEGLWGSSAGEMYALTRLEPPRRFDGSSWQVVDLSSVDSTFITRRIWGFSDGPVWITGVSAGGGLIRGIRP